MSATVSTPVTEATVDLTVLRNNYTILDDIVGSSSEVAAVVKADAYGHGLLPASRALFDAGCRTFCIVTIEEAEILRGEFGEQISILRLVPSLPDEYPEVIRLRLECVIAGLEDTTSWDKYLQREGRTLKAHLKLDCGMGRLGFSEEELTASIAMLEQAPGIELTGVMSHFPASEEGPLSTDSVGVTDYHTTLEIDRFRVLSSEIEARIGRPLVKHIANSGGAIYHPDSRFDLVRAGLALYGADPRGASLESFGLSPALTLQSRIVQVRRLEPGATIGYGRTFRVEEPMLVGVAPVGYADGILHSGSAKAEVLVRGRRCRVLGQISMNLISFELSGMDEDITVGEKVTLLGADGTDRISAEEIARWCGSIPYEILTCIGRLAPRRTIES